MKPQNHYIKISKKEWEALHTLIIGYIFSQKPRLDDYKEMIQCKHYRNGECRLFKGAACLGVCGTYAKKGEQQLEWDEKVKDIEKYINSDSDYNVAVNNYLKYLRGKDEYWIKVEDDLPELEETVLVSGSYADLKDVEQWFTHRTNNKLVLTDSNGFAVYDEKAKITHWMKIVSPDCKPKDDEPNKEASIYRSQES